MIFCYISIFLLNLMLLVQPLKQSQKVFDMKERINRFRESIVRIIVDNEPKGTGFVVSKDGLIATCFHVVQKTEPLSNNTTSITYALNIEIEFTNGLRLPAFIHGSCLNKGFSEAVSKDYCILKVNQNDLIPLKLGSFSDAKEGDIVYMGGYPFGITQPIFAKGMLSTKWKTTGYLNQDEERDVAWLDITMNKGNSGGPIILLSDNPNNDKVIGIASFMLNPFAEPAERIFNFVQGTGGEVLILGVSFREFAKHVNLALMNISLGIGGCVSIDYLKSKIIQNNNTK